MVRDDGTGKLVPVIRYEHAKLMTADQVLALFHFDHYPIRRVDGGADKHFNLVPRFIPEHREKTAVVDVPQLRKADRLRRRHEQSLLRRSIQGEDAELTMEETGALRPFHPRGNWSRRKSKLHSRPFRRKV